MTWLKKLFKKKKPKKKIVQFGHRYHNTMMYVLYDDGSIYYGDPDKDVAWTKLDAPV